MGSPRSRSIRLLPFLVLLAAVAGLNLAGVGRVGGAAPTLAAANASSGALEELERARREQGLIRAESTVVLLRLLERAPTLAGGRP